MDLRNDFVPRDRTQLGRQRLRHRNPAPGPTRKDHSEAYYGYDDRPPGGTLLGRGPL